MEVDNECRMLNKKNKQKEVDMYAKKKDDVKLRLYLD